MSKAWSVGCSWFFEDMVIPPVDSTLILLGVRFSLEVSPDLISQGTTCDRSQRSWLDSNLPAQVVRLTKRGGLILGHSCQVLGPKQSVLISSRRPWLVCKADIETGQRWSASFATDHALRLPTPETHRRGDLPCFLGREPLPRPKRCGEPGSWKAQWLRHPQCCKTIVDTRLCHSGNAASTEARIWTEATVRLGSA